ncbi:MAG: DUF1566 domain-containing protein [Desulfamplus sp.]|nr:DUF1566 domain-containing protein [Desulfamplus sp.]
MKRDTKNFISSFWVVLFFILVFQLNNASNAIGTVRYDVTKPNDRVILTNINPDKTVVTGSFIYIYGTAGINKVTLESGAGAKLINFPGGNVITLQSDASAFTVARSGATVTFQNSTDGTLLVIPATKTAQNIIFNDNKSFDLVVSGGSVMLGSQVVGLTASYIQGGASTTIINGPEGTTVTIPSDTANAGSEVAVSSHTSSDLLSGGELAASPAIQIDTGNKEFIGGNAEYKVDFPVTLTNADPLSLRVMVKLSDGSILPIIGDYNPSSKQYSVKVYGLADNWVMGVVSGNKISMVRSKTRAFPTDRYISNSQRVASNWPSLDFVISPPASQTLTESDIQNDILPIARDMLVRLQSEGFTAPMLQQNQSNGGAYEMYMIDSDIGDGANSYYSPPYSGLLGRIYVYYPDISEYNANSDQSLKFVLMHETFHAVQYGYNYSYGSIPASSDNGNYNCSTAAAYEEGTSNLIGATYSQRGDVGSGGAAYVHTGTSSHLLDKSADDAATSSPYNKQDFFAFLAKRYFSGDLTFLHSMFSYIASSASSGQSASTTDDYMLLYRQGVNLFLASKGYSLPEAYTEYALQRLYLHEPEYLIKDSEKNDDTFAKNTFSQNLLTSNSGHKTWTSKVDNDFQFDALSFSNIKPLSSVAATLTVPADLPETMKDGTLPITISLSGGGQLNQTMAQEGIRILIIRENYGVPVASNPTVTVTDIGSPIEVSLKDSTTHLRIIIINAYYSNTVANITMNVQTGRYQEVAGTNGSVIKDTVTGLEWQRCSVGQTWNSVTKSCDGTQSTFDWNTAAALTQTGGWRTPTLSELATLVYCTDPPPVIGLTNERYSCGMNGNTFQIPTIWKDAFPINLDAEEHWYWSSTKQEGWGENPGWGYGVSFYWGTYNYWDFTNLNPVRLVKSP